MKTNWITTSAAAALLALSCQAQASGKFSGFEGAEQVGVQSAYDDVFAWCGNYITDLQNVRWNASLEASMGALDTASARLLSELQAKASHFGSEFDIEPAPHTVMAIRAGFNIAQELVIALQSESLPPVLVKQLKYVALDQIYDLIEKTYLNLDQRFYREVVSTCGRHGCGGSYTGLPAEYFDGIRQVGLSFLNFQIQNAQMQASDIVELRVSRAVVHAAREILNGSVFRRTMACGINRLDAIEKQITAFLCGSAISRPNQVHLTRGLMAEARDLLNSACPTYNSNCGCGARM